MQRMVPKKTINRQGKKVYRQMDERGKIKKGREMIDICPKCKKHTLSYNIYNHIAVCYNKKCAFKEAISQKEYIIKYADKSRYVVLPPYIKQKRLTSSLRKEEK